MEKIKGHNFEPYNVAPRVIYDPNPDHDGYLIYDVTEILGGLELPDALEVDGQVVSLKKDELHVSILNAKVLQAPHNDNRQPVMEVYVPQIIEKTPLEFRGFTGRLFVCEKSPKEEGGAPRRSIVAEALVDGTDNLRNMMHETVNRQYVPGLLHVTLYTSDNAPHGLSIDTKQDEVKYTKDCTTKYPEVVEMLLGYRSNIDATGR